MKYTEIRWQREDLQQSTTLLSLRLVGRNRLIKFTIRKINVPEEVTAANAFVPKNFPTTKLTRRIIKLLEYLA